MSDVVDVKLTLCVISVVLEFVSTGLVSLKVIMTTLSVVSTPAVVSTVLVGENGVMATLSVVAYKSVGKYYRFERKGIITKNSTVENRYDCRYQGNQ
jgi:uncharacterized membrane protein